MNWFRKLRLRIRLAQIKSCLSARNEALDYELNQADEISQRVRAHERAIKALKKESLSIQSALATEENAQPITDA